MRRPPLLPGAARPLVFGHRGLPELAPENTMASFRMAAARGVPGVELDLRLSADGELAVIHDSFTGRVARGGADGALKVERSSWRDLAALDVGAWKGAAFSGERIPRLGELFEELGDRLYWDLELKNERLADYGLEAAVAAAISGARLEERCIVSSLNPFAIARFKRLMPEVPTAIIWYEGKSLPFWLRRGQGRWIGAADLLKPEWSTLGRLSARRGSKPRRRAILPWTVDEAPQARRLLEAGCVGLISNRPLDLGLPLPGAAP